MDAMTSYRLHGGRPETVAAATVTRENGHVRICVRELPPPGTYGTIRLAEPVTIAAAEHVVVEFPWDGHGFPVAEQARSFRADSPLTVTALHGWPPPGP